MKYIAMKMITHQNNNNNNHYHKSGCNNDDNNIDIDIDIDQECCLLNHDQQATTKCRSTSRYRKQYCPSDSSCSSSSTSWFHSMNFMTNGNNGNVRFIPIRMGRLLIKAMRVSIEF